MNLVLIGMMGCGKSTCGQLLAKRLGRTFMDTDLLIQKQTGRSIPDIFAHEGEEYFRDLEQAVAEDLSKRSNLVIATGGGIILRKENVTALRSSGTVIWLNRSAEDIFSKVSMKNRPLGQDGLRAFLSRADQREPLYRAAAHMEVPSQSSPMSTVDFILKNLPLIR